MKATTILSLSIIILSILLLVIIINIIWNSDNISVSNIRVIVYVF